MKGFHKMSDKGVQRDYVERRFYKYGDGLDEQIERARNDRGRGRKRALAEARARGQAALAAGRVGPVGKP